MLFVDCPDRIVFAVNVWGFLIALAGFIYNGISAISLWIMYYRCSKYIRQISDNREYVLERICNSTDDFNYDQHASEYEHMFSQYIDISERMNSVIAASKSIHPSVYFWAFIVLIITLIAAPDTTTVALIRISNSMQILPLAFVLIDLFFEIEIPDSRRRYLDDLKSGLADNAKCTEQIDILIDELKRRKHGVGSKS